MNCAKLSPAEYEVLSGGNSAIHWYCRSCSMVTGRLVEDMAVLKTKQNVMQKELASIKLKLSDVNIDEKIAVAVKAAVDSISASRTTHPSPPVDFVKSQEFRRIVQDESREIAEREKRKHSIIVKGLGTDPAVVLRELTEVGMEIIGSPVKIVDVVVINSEMVRGKILDLEQRKRFLAAAKNLKSSTRFSSVYVNRDLTRSQREQLAEWRANNRRAGHSGYVRNPESVVTGANAIPIATRDVPQTETTAMYGLPSLLQSSTSLMDGESTRRDNTTIVPRGPPVGGPDSSAASNPAPSSV